MISKVLIRRALLTAAAHEFPRFVTTFADPLSPVLCVGWCQSRDIERAFETSGLCLSQGKVFLLCPFSILLLLSFPFLSLFFFSRNVSSELVADRIDRIPYLTNCEMLNSIANVEGSVGNSRT
jgi:hypothetical protein